MTLRVIRRYRSAFILSVIVIISIVGVSMLLGLDTSLATPREILDCEHRINWECSPNKKNPTPYLICPNPRVPCPLDAAK